MEPERLQQGPPFESWAIVEVMGHLSLAGKVTEERIAGAGFLRVDVPEIPTRKQPEWDGQEKELPAVPAYSRYFGGSSIYSLTPCSEEIARAAAARFCQAPPGILTAPVSRQIAAARNLEDYEQEVDQEETLPYGCEKCELVTHDLHRCTHCDDDFCATCIADHACYGQAEDEPEDGEEELEPAAREPAP